MNVREFPFEKSVILNAAYDVLDRLAIPMTWADSRSGFLRFGDGGQMELTAILREGGVVTRVEITDQEQIPAEILLDELHATLEQSFHADETGRRKIV